MNFLLKMTLTNTNEKALPTHIFELLNSY